MMPLRRVRLGKSKSEELFMCGVFNCVFCIADQISLEMLL